MSLLGRIMLGVCMAAALMLTTAPPPALAQGGTCASKHACNCVYYARCKVPSLPTGLTYMEGKRRIINSYVPAVGSVAIMNVGLPYGHVGVVTAVKRDARGNVTSITVDEANYKACKVGTRTGSPATLKVVGYFRPGVSRP